MSFAVQAPDGSVHSASALIPRPSNPTLAASWDVVVARCDPPDPVTTFRGPGGYVSTTTPPTPAAVSPSIITSGSWISGRAPIGADLAELANTAVTKFRRAADLGSCGHALVFDDDGSGLRFVLFHGDAPLTAVDITHHAELAPEPVASGYAVGATWRAGTVL